MIQSFKKPKSEAESFKRSPKGAVIVHGESGAYTMTDEHTMQEARDDKENQMRCIYENGKHYPITPLHTIRKRIQNELER